MNFDREIVYKEYVEREESILRTPYNTELEFYHFVKNGDVERVKESCEKEPLIEKPGLGTLSKNRLQNMKYHFAITTALVARFCIDGGMEHSAAYVLSDMYIQKADEATSIEQISMLHPQMCLDYARRMRSLSNNRIDSKYINTIIDYIYGHLHTKITLTELADYVGLNPSYLSKLFTSKMNISISEYICKRKIDTAMNMLRNSDYSVAQISSILAFSSQSYFNDVFKKRTGMTPSQYRNSDSLPIT